MHASDWAPGPDSVSPADLDALIALGPDEQQILVCQLKLCGADDACCGAHAAQGSELWCLVPRLLRHGLSLANEAGLFVSSLVRLGLASILQATSGALTSHAAL